MVGRVLHHLEEVGSTNDEALRDGADGTVILAERQRAGRGRHGRTWHSAPGLGLWMSVAFTRPVPGLAFGTALALRDALAPYAPIRVKWPNDILSGRRKLAGMLLESRGGRTALGIGVNVCHQIEDLPPELRQTATSIALVAEQPVDRQCVLDAIIVSLDQRVVQLRSGGQDALFEEWAAACAMAGQRVQHEGVGGIVIGIDSNGGLQVTTDSGLRTILFGQTIAMETE